MTEKTSPTKCNTGSNGWKYVGMIISIIGMGWFLMMAFRSALFTPEEMIYPMNIVLTGLFFATGITMLYLPITMVYRYIKFRKKESIHDTTEC